MIVRMLRYSPQQERNRRCEPIDSIAQLSSPATTRCAHATVAIGRPIETNVNSLKSLRRHTAQPGKVLAAGLDTNTGLPHDSLFARRPLSAFPHAFQPVLLRQRRE